MKNLFLTLVLLFGLNSFSFGIIEIAKENINLELPSPNEMGNSEEMIVLACVDIGEAVGMYYINEEGYSAQDAATIASNVITVCCNVTGSC